MNIKRAKQEIRDTIEAYLAKDEFGAYRIPEIRQRPVLLMGPPGIGKTQIMEQIASECGYGNVKFFSTVFLKTEGLSPTAYRNRFSRIHQNNA